MCPHVGRLVIGSMAEVELPYDAPRRRVFNLIFLLVTELLAEATEVSTLVSLRERGHGFGLTTVEGLIQAEDGLTRVLVLVKHFDSLLVGVKETWGMLAHLACSGQTQNTGTLAGYEPTAVRLVDVWLHHELIDVHFRFMLGRLVEIRRALFLL